MQTMTKPELTVEMLNDGVLNEWGQVRMLSVLAEIARVRLDQLTIRVAAIEGQVLP